MNKNHMNLSCTNDQYHSLAAMVGKYEDRKSQMIYVDKTALSNLLKDHGDVISKVKSLGITVHEDPLRGNEVENPLLAAANE